MNTPTLLGLALILVSPSLPAATLSVGASNDTWIRDGFSHASNGSDGVLDARLQFVPYVQFDLSGLDIDTISAATLRLWKVGSARNDTITTGRFATYGLPLNPGNTLQVWDELADFDPTDATNGLDFRNVGADWLNDAAANGVNRSVLVSLDADDGAAVSESVDNGTGEIVLSGADLVGFLNGRADDNGLVTFLLPVEAGGAGWGIASKENPDPALHPQLDLEFTTIPEPSTALLGTLGLLAVLRRRR